MAATLLDVNVLVALAWPQHMHHAAARHWFDARRSRRWATCPLTQLAFVRLSSQPAVVKTAIAVKDAIRVLDAAITSPGHEFWPMDQGFPELLPEIRQRLMGHHQLTDAFLLNLAIQKHGRFATFDRRVESLLAPASAHENALETLPIE